MIANPATPKASGASRNVTLIIDGTKQNGGADIATGTDGKYEYFTWNRGEIVTKVVPVGSILWGQYMRRVTIIGEYIALRSVSPSFDVYSILGDCTVIVES